MKKILLSVATLGAAAAIGVFATGAFFSDKETSTGNNFTAGAIDIKIDSTAHYAGLICKAFPVVSSVAPPVYKWVLENAGIPSSRPDLVDQPCDGSWFSTDLTSQKFFNYDDLKPGDPGEDTISIKVDNNDAWACAEITVTGDDDVSCTTPEKAIDTSCSLDTGVYNGEMRKNLSFAWWPDDGDNILEPGVEYDHMFYKSGVKIDSLLDAQHKIYLTLADSSQSFFDTPTKPLAGGHTYYVGSAWCFGDMEISTSGVITCDGQPVTNEAQTDKMTADISFSAVQSRNNPIYTCQDTFRPH